VGASAPAPCTTAEGESALGRSTEVSARCTPEEGPGEREIVQERLFWGGPTPALCSGGSQEASQTALVQGGSVLGGPTPAFCSRGSLRKLP